MIDVIAGNSVKEVLLKKIMWLHIQLYSYIEEAIYNHIWQSQIWYLIIWLTANSTKSLKS